MDLITAKSQNKCLWNWFLFKNRQKKKIQRANVAEVMKPKKSTTQFENSTESFLSSTDKV